MIRDRLAGRSQIVALLIAFGAVAQAPDRFVAADVHASSQSGSRDPRSVSGGLMRDGRFYLRSAAMSDLVRMAYETDAHHVVGGPNWLETDRFDIRARVPSGTGADSVKPMLRALLAERFGLAVHREVRPVAAWALTAGKRVGLRRSEGSDESGCESRGAGDVVRVVCRHTTMAQLVAGLGGMDGAWYYVGDNLVVDRTGIEGAFDFELRYSRRWTATAPGAEILSLFDAVGRIGLELTAATIPMDVVVVDSVNRLPTPNSDEPDKALPPPPGSFDVTVVKPSDPGGASEDLKVLDGGRVTVRGATLESLIADAWGIPPDRIANAPKFLVSARWDVTAKAPGLFVWNGNADMDSVRALMRALLTERFGLAAHYEERAMPALTMSASKPKLKQADPAARSGCREGPPSLGMPDARAANPVLGRLLTCTNVSMAWFAEELPWVASGYVHSDVLDATGLQGGWDFTLSFSKAAQWRGEIAEPGKLPEPNGALSAPEAMERQLGLKLEMRKRPVRVLVIDRVQEKPSEN